MSESRKIYNPAIQRNISIVKRSQREQKEMEVQVDREREREGGKEGRRFVD